MSTRSIIVCTVFIFIFLLPASATEDNVATLYGTGYLEGGDRTCDHCEVWCSCLEIEWHYGITWQYGGIIGPTYGAFAMPCSMDVEVEHKCLDCICFFFTQNGNQTNQTIDVYVWDNNDIFECRPGNVICMLPDVEPGIIGQWPNFSFHCVDMNCYVNCEGLVWLGYWPNWPDEAAGWFIMAGEAWHCPCPGMINSGPGSGYPPGWVPISLVWGENIEIVAIEGCWWDCSTSSLPAADEPVPLPKTWGSVKSFYR